MDGEAPGLFVEKSPNTSSTGMTWIEDVGYQCYAEEMGIGDARALLGCPPRTWQ